MNETVSKTERQRLVAALIRTGKMGSQEELVERLADRGLQVTQATVSRDLSELGAMKIRRHGRLGYALPEDGDNGAYNAERLGRLLSEWVVGAEAAGALLVLKTPPGSAHLVGSALDHAGWPEIAGTISGDDTLLLVVRDGHAVGDLLARVRDLAALE